MEKVQVNFNLKQFNVLLKLVKGNLNIFFKLKIFIRADYTVACGLCILVETLFEVGNFASAKYHGMIATKMLDELKIRHTPLYRYTLLGIAYLEKDVKNIIIIIYNIVV